MKSFLCLFVSIESKWERDEIEEDGEKRATGKYLLALVD
jgi:hypothetical protein